MLLLRLRLLRAEREFNAVLGERNRIAREIHDTLAQGYVGISVQLEVLAELLRQRKVDDAAKQLDQTRDHVREGLADARQSIWALRTQDAGETTLPVQLRRMAEQAGAMGSTAQLQHLMGVSAAAAGARSARLLRVAQEAIHNVKKHAGGAASVGSAGIRAGRSCAGSAGRWTRVGAAGCEQRNARRGHFGLTGMRERAAAIGGTLEM